MKRKFQLFLLICFYGSVAFGQTRKVSGHVTANATGQPLNGVTVTVKNTDIRTATNREGQYTIAVPEKGNAVLEFSSVGYTAEEVPVGQKATINIVMTIASNAMSEVVVIGYQTVRRRDLTSAVSSVTAKQLKDVPVNSAAEALAGKLAGVQVTVSEGAPGADVDIYVRGRGSITQSAAPLYVVDGVETENALSILSPQDIESIDVLKDAASTAIYGARGANGVVLITTKGGKNMGGKTIVNYNAFAGFNQLAKKLDLMDPYNFVLLGYERAMYTGNPLDTAVAAQYINRMSNYDTLDTYRHYPDAMDWQDATMGRRAFQMTHNVAVTGGNAATQYNLSLTYNKQEGLIANSDYDRKLASFRFDHKVSDNLKVGFNVRYNLQNVTGAGTSDLAGAGSNRLRQYVRYRPLILPGQSADFYDADLDARNPGNGLNELNPLKLMSNEYRLRTITAYNFSGYANLNITRSLQFRSTFGYNVTETESRGYDDTLTANARSNARMPVLNRNNVYLSTINNSNVFTYSIPSIAGSKHAVDLLVGQEIYQTNTRSNAQEVRFFPIGTKPDMAFANLGLAAPPVGQVQPKPSSSEINTTQLSFFSRLSYNFDRKYLLTLNFRADGSSLFGPDYSSPIPLKDSTNRKWGYFPSAAVAWRFSEEKFMKSLTFVNEAKLRFSYGKAGNNRLQAYGYTTGYAPPFNGGYGLNDVLNYTLTLPGRLGNPYITWESLASENLGLDLTLFNNRLNITADIYNNVTSNLLLENKIPPTSGYTTQYQNLGTIQNRGIELQLAGDIIRSTGFNWSANFNITFNKNKIVSLGSNRQFTANSGWFSSTNNPDDYILRVGDEVGTMYGLKVLGYYTVADFTTKRVYNPQFPNLTWQYDLDPKLANPQKVLADKVAPGQIRFADINGDGQITLDADRTVIGHALPRFTGGFNQQFGYKGFDASIYMNFSYGNQIFNANRLEFANAYGVDENMLSLMDSRWKVIDSKGRLVQKEIANKVIGVSPDSLAAINAHAAFWQPSRSTNGFAPMSFAVEDGSYLRINTVTLGYTFSRKTLKRAGVSSLRVYATVYNVATITGYSGYDPDVNARRYTPLTPGVDYAAYPRGRTFLAGLNLNF